MANNREATAFLPETDSSGSTNSTGMGIITSVLELLKGAPVTPAQVPPGLFDDKPDNTALYGGVFLLVFMIVILLLVFKSK